MVKEVSENMREWYFETGGIYLSRQSHIPYFSLKEVIEKCNI